MRREKGDIFRDPKDTKQIIRKYYKQLMPINLTTQMKGTIS